MIRNIKFSENRTEETRYFVIEIYISFHKTPIVLHLDTEMELKQAAMKLMTAAMEFLGDD